MNWRVLYECDFCWALHEMEFDTPQFPQEIKCTRCGVGIMRVRDIEHRDRSR